MRMSADPGLVKRLSVFASGASVFSMAIGLSGLSGWVLHLSRLTTWGFALVKMVANTAACFVLLGVSLWLLRRRTSQTFSRTRSLAAKALAAIAGVFGMLSLAEHLFTVESWALTRYWFVSAATDHAAGVSPGLMSSLTALDFFLLGFAILLLDRRTRRDDWPAQFLCLGAAHPRRVWTGCLASGAGCFSHEHGVANGGYVLSPDLWTAVLPGRLGHWRTSYQTQHSGARLLRRRSSFSSAGPEPYRLARSRNPCLRGRTSPGLK